MSNDLASVEYRRKYTGCLTCVTRKQTKVFVVVIPKEFDSADIIDYILEKSMSYQKKDGRSHARPSFFWYDNDKDPKVCFLVAQVVWIVVSWVMYKN